MEQYKQINRQVRKERYFHFVNKSKNMLSRLNPYPRFKYNYLTKKNKAPDVSTITEHIALILDNQVVEIIHCQPKMAAILLSSPEIIQIPEGKVIKPGWKYEDGEFVVPEVQQQQQRQQEDDGLSTFKDQFERVKNNIPHPEKPLSFKEYISKIKERK